MKFKNKMILSVLTISFIPLLFSYSIFVNDKIKSNSENIENNLSEIALLVSQNSFIRTQIENKQNDHSVENIANEYISIFRDVDIIVVADIEGIKYSHLDKKQIGTQFVNPVEWDTLKSKKGYFSKMKGSMGITYRRFEPIYSLNGDVIIGFVMVGKYYDTIFKMNKDTLFLFFTLFLGVLIFSLLLAVRCTINIRNIFFGLEPQEIKRLYDEEKLIVDNLESGLIALDDKNNILKTNSVFRKKYSSIAPEKILKKVETYLSLTENKKIKNLELSINEEKFHIKILPMYNNNIYFGSTLLIKRHNDVDSFAREITGIDQLVEGMRANIHEFKNRLHVILGLINLEKYDMAKKYIMEIQEINEYDFKKLINIKNPFIKAILLGKGAIAKERKIEFIIETSGNIFEEVKDDLIRDLGTIIGNLIENALDSCKNFEISKKIIKVKIIETDRYIEFIVSDNGQQISQENLNKIYDYGFSTKGNQRGVGLSLVKEKLSLYNGTIELDQNKNLKFFTVKVEK